MITCGNHHATHGKTVVKHESIKSVGDCYNPAIETFLCGELMQVPTASITNDPEWYPDFPSDVYTVVECGSLAYMDQNGWHCENGHKHLTYGSPEQQAEERMEAMVEELASRNPQIAARLDAGESWQRIMAS